MYQEQEQEQTPLAVLALHCHVSRRLPLVDVRLVLSAPSVRRKGVASKLLGFSLLCASRDWDLQRIQQGACVSVRVPLVPCTSLKACACVQRKCV